MMIVSVHRNRTRNWNVGLSLVFFARSGSKTPDRSFAVSMKAEPSDLSVGIASAAELNRCAGSSVLVRCNPGLRQGYTSYYIVGAT